MLRGASVFLASAALVAQGPPPNGPRSVDPGWFALVHARVVPAPGQALADATVVVRDGVVRAVGTAPPPAGATVVDCTGLTIYPGLIEPFLATDVPALDPAAADQHWNTMLQPQRNARDGAGAPPADRTALRELGFTTVAIAPSGGILKGTSSVVLLDEPTDTEPTRVVAARAYQLASLQTRWDGYPNSEMGAIALLRQTLLDADWYERCRNTVAAHGELATAAPPASAVLQAIADQRALPMWFDVQDELQALRVLKIATEFDRKPVVLGSGMEFRRLAALAAAKAPIVVPVELPDAPDVSTAAMSERVTLRHLLSWEQAPTNSKRLLDAGVTIAWTTARLKKRGEFWARVAEAMRCGVTADQALAALTTVPAELLGIAAQTGTIAPGKLANLVVVDGELLTKEPKVRDVWVGGRRHIVKQRPDQGLDGTWAWSRGWPGKPPETAPRLAIAGEKVTCKLGDKVLKVAAVARTATTLDCRVALGEAGGEATVWLSLYREGDELAGSVTAAADRPLPFRATREPGEAAPAGGDHADAPKDPKTEDPQTKDPQAMDPQTMGREAKDRGADDPPPSLDPLPTPLGGFAIGPMPAAKPFAIVGAELWTGDGRGVFRNGAVYVRDGKIVYAGPRADLPRLPDDVEVIEANGRHVTPGIIDCHSHTGISRGVNESGQAVTAEVRIADVLDPDDVNWYRELAGGVTTVNQLHGSANAIGGQSQTTKLRYGVANPDDMHFAGAPAGIKWALGENPRGANGGGSRTRYPGTRMGVEALLRDRLAAATAYAREQERYAALAPGARSQVLPPRRDLELEALTEVLAGTRRIHCHSYRQDEIFMLCGLAHEYGIKIGTFQHVLEGYKVADAIRQAAVGASSFSDWWAYKFEVYDAIPENGAIMHEAGVCVSFNSDSDEHARRLNTEAGKAVKYGGVAPQAALGFVTSNPAIQLGVFDRTGSLTAGKDADIALWSGDPLSYLSRCEATWVDGRKLFSLEQDEAARAWVQRERQRLLGKALRAGADRKPRGDDAKDAAKDPYWAAEDLTGSYCCRSEGER